MKRGKSWQRDDGTSRSWRIKKEKEREENKRRAREENPLDAFIEEIKEETERANQERQSNFTWGDGSVYVTSESGSNDWKVVGGTGSGGTGKSWSLPASEPSQDIQRAFREMKKVMEDASVRMDEMTTGVFRAKRKRITWVEVITRREPIDITSATDSFQVYASTGPALHEWMDQDGEPLPKELEERFVEILSTQQAVSPEQVRRVLAEWNDGPAPDPVRATKAQPGHLTNCVYLGTHHFACTCQPPTFFGRQLLWLCDCCGHPRAQVQYGLCDLCKTHQYDRGQAQADHEAHLA